MSGWDGWSWAGVVATAFGVGLLVAVVRIGDAWPGSFVIVLFGLLAVGSGLVLLFPRQAPESSDDEEVPQ